MVVKVVVKKGKNIINYKIDAIAEKLWKNFLGLELKNFYKIVAIARKMQSITNCNEN